MNALKAQLRFFGLNPTEWRLRLLNEKIYVIHRKDSSLQFVGTFPLRDLVLVES